jgi:hypothetical protein
VFISAVSYGDNVALSYQANAASTTDVNVIKFADFKLNITRDCSDVANINGNAQKAGSGKVDTDSRSLDVTQYHLVNAAELPH